MAEESEVLRFELQALNRRLGAWRVEFDEAAAHLEAVEGGTRVSVGRGDTAGRLELHDLPGGQGVLVLPKEGERKKLQFKLTREQREAIDRWLGPRTHAHLRVVLRRRYAWGIPAGLILVLASLPMPADPAAGLEAVPASPLTAFLGLGLVGMWLVARLRPTPRLLLVDCVWFLLLLGSLVADVVAGRASPSGCCGVSCCCSWCTPACASTGASSTCRAGPSSRRRSTGRASSAAA